MGINAEILEVVVDKVPNIQGARPEEADGEVDYDVKEGFKLVGDRECESWLFQ